MIGVLAGLASFALQGASALAAHGAQKKAAAANRASATSAYKLNRADLGAREAQANQAAAYDVYNLSQEGQAAASTAAASAADSGVAGGSVSALLATYLGDTRRAQDAVGQNLDNVTSELNRRQEAAAMEYRDRLKAVQAPSGLNLGLELGSAALSAAPSVLPYLRGSGTTGARSAALDKIGESTPIPSLKLTRKY